MKIVIYGRVSTDLQDIKPQIEELKEYALKLTDEKNIKILYDIESGANSKRKDYESLKELVFKKKVDLVLVWKLDRLARNVRELIDFFTLLDENGVNIKIYTQNIDTTTPTGKLMFYIVAAFAEFERDLIRERIKLGMRRTEKKVGRARISDDTIKQIYLLRKKGKSYSQITKELEVSKGTVARYIRAIETINMVVRFLFRPLNL